MKQMNVIKWIPLLLLLSFLTACGGGSDSASSGNTGTLSLSMVDASDETFKAVYVSIEEVQVCYETGFVEGDEDTACEWQTIATPNKTYNLLTLVNGVTAELGEAELEVGTYNQMRLILADAPDDSLNIFGDPHPADMPQYLIRQDDTLYPMKVPSGYNSGIKLVSQFEIEDSETTELILDFDVTRSIHLAGKIDNNGKYILKPTIKVTGTYNRAVVSGMIYNAAYLDQPLPNATVTAWPVDDSSLTATSTQSDENGNYSFNLGMGEAPEASQAYTLVATLNGYIPDCVQINVAANQTYPDTDFGLSDADMVTVSGTVSGNIASALLPEGATFPSVHISFQQDCLTIPVEIAFTDTTDDADASTADIFYDDASGNFQYTYEIEIPAGTYDVVASTDGLTSVEKPGAAATAATTLDIDFSVTP